MKKIILVLSLLGFGVGAGLSGCGGGGGSSGSCPNAPACGGVIVGTWNVTSSCVNVAVDMFAAQCPSATVSSAAGLTISGSATYNADLTYSSNSTLSGNATVNFPTSCLKAQGITTCDEVAQSYAGDPFFTSVSCVTTASGCSCTGAVPPDSSAESGTYTATAAGLLTQIAAGDTCQSDFCVTGTMLTMSPHAGSSVMGQGSVSGTITFTKQ